MVEETSSIQKDSDVTYNFITSEDHQTFMANRI